MRGGKLEPVELPHGYQPVGMRDVDGDGLWDVLTHGPYAGIGHDTAIGGDVPYFSAPEMFLLHSLGGFRFSTDDLWAQKTIRTLCPRKVLSREDNSDLLGLEPPDDASPDWRNPMQIVCARTFGDDSATAEAAIRAQCKNFDARPFDGKACFSSLLDLARAQPPLRLEDEQDAR